MRQQTGPNATRIVADSCCYSARSPGGADTVGQEEVDVAELLESDHAKRRKTPERRRAQSFTWNTDAGLRLAAA